MTLHYIEAFDHTELIERWIPILATIEDLKIVVHVNPWYRDQLTTYCRTLTGVELRGPVGCLSWSDYLERLQFSSTCVAFIATLGKRTEWFYSLAGRVRYAVLLHNLNNCFDRKEYRHPPERIVDRLKDLRTLIRKRSHRRFLASAGALTYATAALASEGKKESFLYAVPHLVLPFAAYQAGCKILNRPAASSGLRVIIPGTVTERTRDYQAVIDALVIVAESEAPMHVHLAGRFRNPTLEQLFQTRLAHAFSHPATGPLTIHKYPNGLNKTDFDRLLAESDLILAPLKTPVTVGRYQEQIGRTKALGTPFDAIFFKKPLLLPAWHPVQDPAVIPYSSANDLGHILINFAKGNRELPVNCWEHYSHFQLREYWKAVLASLAE
ncbi:hypothetical protein GGR26_001469 [Lewinella marina]|uniref:Glycosyltransferase n=1 Tax=Neolewinella marina TaxID=438751 RepID=A0A2G0CFA0_9BACT|nr:hypothetical protein [Neolewinella marina]NJB85724.1 hypothetical protein [Neolewinella marina]PHK98600.1 hypothetical protein CGL56_09000 [Neolewinella marina]